MKIFEEETGKLLFHGTKDDFKDFVHKRIAHFMDKEYYEISTLLFKRTVRA